MNLLTPHTHSSGWLICTKCRHKVKEKQFRNTNRKVTIYAPKQNKIFVFYFCSRVSRYSSLLEFCLSIFCRKKKEKEKQNKIFVFYFCSRVSRYSSLLEFCLSIFCRKKKEKEKKTRIPLETKPSR